MATIPKPVTLDFETDAIGPRPHYPPVPVGCAIRGIGEKARYLAWGHPDKNNTTKTEATKILLRYWTSGPVLFHNGKFDYDVGTTHLGLPELPWDAIHDTLFLIFLQNPNRKTLSLKPVAEAELGLPPNERDAVRDWLVEHGVCKATKGWGAFISKAPGDLVGKYAVGDVDRTYKLFQKYYKEVVVTRGMAEAYDRERELMPTLLESERIGIHLDTKSLELDTEQYIAAMERTDDWIRGRLKNKNLNVDSNEELAEAIQQAKAGDEEKWERTPSGALSTAKDVLDEALLDRPLAGALAYRGILATCVRTFMVPWRATARESGGLIYTSWNQVAQDYHDSGARKGTRTGRLSSTPNFQNIPNNFDDKPRIIANLASARKVKTLAAIINNYGLPSVRSYIIAPPGGVLLNRDYSQQELRILAHYENGALMQAYLEDPWLDMHVFVQKIVSELLGIQVDRKPIKNLNFGLIYGMGIGKLAKSMGLPVDQSKQIKAAHKKGFPGVKDLMDDMTTRARRGQSIRTWGGREYFCEDPITLENGKVVEFAYKLTNTLIQGSAADNTKQAMINFARRKKEQGLKGNLLINVHDELLHDSPRDRRVVEMCALRDAMQDVKFDVPMLSTGGYGPRWTEIKKLKRGD